MGDSANPYKIKWKEKGTPILYGKTLRMRETPMRQSRENNSLCDKIETKYYSSIALI